MRFGSGYKQLLALVTAAALLASIAWHALPPISRWNQRQLANQIAKHIEKTGHAEASEPIRRLANLGTPAIDPLVTLAGSHRTSLALRARQIVEEKFATWLTRAGLDDNFDLATPTTTLASALVSNTDRFDPTGKRWAESLATRMVDLTESLSAEDAKKLLRVCDQIFATVPPHGPRLRSLPEAAQQRLTVAENRLNAPDIRLDLLAIPSESGREIFSRRPRNSLREDKTPMVETPGNPDSIFSEPTTPPSELDFKHSRWSPQWNTHSDAHEPALAPNIHAEPIPIPNFGRITSLASEVVDVPTPLEMEQRQVILRKESSRMLIAQLPKADHYEAGSIRVVLRQRGFSETELELAELLSSSRVEDRNQLVEAVSALSAGKARRWLRWLLEDDSAEVRLRALTFLATTNDPQLFRLAREMAVEDQDDRVSELASRIMRDVR